jgi:hypothetical protein
MHNINTNQPSIVCQPISLALMLEAEVQSFIALIFGCAQVLQSLVFAHRLPLSVTLSVPPYIVDFGEEVQNNVHAVDGKQLPVAPPV